MLYAALAVDYDGTLATDGVVPEAVVASLRRVRSAGVRLLLITGRELPDLFGTFAHCDLFDRIVAENGGLLYEPATARKVALASPPPAAFVEALRARNVRFSLGEVLVALLETELPAAEQAIVASKAEVDVILNKGSVMILPSGVNKGTGIARAAGELGLLLARVVAMGDGENDHSLLRAAGLGIAVANAVPALKAQADAVTQGARGAGVIEIAERLLADDFIGFAPRPRGESVATPDDAALASAASLPEKA